MNKILITILFLFLPVCLIAQRSPVYIWQDSITTTTTEVDCTFNEEWYQVTMVADGDDAWLKVSTGTDTVSWSSRTWTKLKSNSSVTFGPLSKVKNLTVKAVTDTVTLYMIGLKLNARYSALLNWTERYGTLTTPYQKWKANFNWSYYNGRKYKCILGN